MSDVVACLVRGLVEPSGVFSELNVIRANDNEPLTVCQ